ncbi:L-type lectin-domain containing protein [Carnobacterium divergens]|uniref:L-type lectin-domain containing protein n=1 Tax=Carnobacterium divergens TaxID=2748 RepID=UPI00054D9ACF|nr:L-type lectin-domain containing protein [Carnobacterium divergens]MDO0874748.1 L-type lectin-domain containing protein [Carnobacterium divergens]SUX16138.1 Legume lectin domain [Carnobacterium divergens]
MKYIPKIILLLPVISIFYLNPEKSLADNSSSPPNGIEIDNVFQTPEGANSSVINTGLVDIVEVTPNQKNQAGAIWNTDNNMMDLTKNFEASMYLYFGDKGKDAADGMAFVMQADPNGNKAFRTGDGARLGVWDSTKKGEFGLAISNSIAVEFDTYYNNDFDSQIAKNRNHLAWNYPGEKSTYDDPWLGSRRMNHNDIQYPISNYFSNDQWHKFSVKWGASASILTYQFESLNPVSIPINVDTTFGTNQVFWGFTGSTGGSYASNRVVFEKVPGLVEGSIEEKVIDKNTGLSIQNKSVNSEAKLTYSIDVNYQSGKQDWKEVHVMKNLNDNIEYLPGSLRSIDSDGNETPLSDAYWSGNELNLPLGDLGVENKQKKIVFDVKVKSVPVNTEVSESVIAKGKNYITHSDNFNYTIISNVAPVITLEGANQEKVVDNGTDIEITGNWLDKDSETVSLYYQVNDSSPLVFEKETINDPKDTKHNYLATVSSTELLLGANSLKVWAVDKEGAQSNVETITILVRGTLKFVNVPDFEFGQFSLPLKNELLFSSTKETIKISDTRGTGSDWKLNVTLKKPFTSLEGNTINDFYYINQDNQKQPIQLNELILVRTGVTQESSIQEIGWAPNQGLALEILPSNYIGEYSSELEWILEDTPSS